MLVLLDGAGPDVTGVGQSVESPHRFNTARRTLYVSGVFGGAAVEVDLSPTPAGVPDAQSVWIPVADLSFREAGFVNVEASFGKIRARVVGGTSGAAAPEDNTAVRAELV